MPSTTPRQIIVSALEDLGVLAIGETPEAALTAQGLRRLNQVVRSLSLDRLSIPYRDREVFPLTANQGGADNPYTIGPGGDFDTSRPDDLDGAGIVYPVQVSPSQRYEVPIGLMTEDAYQALTTKALTSTFPFQILYERTFTDGLGRIITYPIPDNSDYSLAIYRWTPLDEFADLTTSVDLPVSYDELLEYELACRWASSFTKPCPAEIVEYARKTRAQITHANLAASMSDLRSDADLLGPPEFVNIFQGIGVD